MLRNIPVIYVLGGGPGIRIKPLTDKRAKPAVPFGGNYRVIDFVLSNIYHSGLRKIFVLTQWESTSLERHLDDGWRPRFGTGGDEFLRRLGAIMGEQREWYKGTANAIYQNVRYIKEHEPNLVDVFGADHIYLMDISQMNDFHLEKESDLTISAVAVKRELAAGEYGVLVVDDKWQLIDFEEKPLDPTPMPGNNEYCLASMGNYAFKPDVLLEELMKDAPKNTPRSSNGEIDYPNIKKYPEKFSSHDFGFDIIPAVKRAGKKIFVYNFRDNRVPGMSEKEIGFWRDIGNLDQFYEANMEMRSVEPPLNLYNKEWPVLTYVEFTQPAKFIIGGKALESIVANNVIVSNSLVERSVISYNVQLENSHIEDSILLGNNYVEEAIIKRSIVDKNVKVPKGEKIGVDSIKDKKRGFEISGKGVTVVPRDYKF